MSKKGRARAGTIKRTAGSGGGLKHLAGPAAGTLKVWSGTSWATVGWGGVMDYEPKWNVKPTDTLSGSIGAHAHWEAVRVTGGVVTHEIQMAKYACRIWTTGDLRRSGGGGWAPPVMIGPFSVLHRPDDGDVGLAAKVLAMAAVQPGWDSYKAYVKELG